MRCTLLGIVLDSALYKPPCRVQTVETGVPSDNRTMKWQSKILPSIGYFFCLAMRFFTLFAPTCFVAKDNRCFELMQICDLIADYSQIKVTCLCLHFLTDGYGKEINLAKPVREICENAKFSKDNNSSVT